MNQFYGNFGVENINSGMGALDPSTFPTLAAGSKDARKGGTAGDNVTFLQTKLMGLGYSMPRYGADGSFGGETTIAVRAFQKANGLSITGIFNSECWSKLLAGAPVKAAKLLSKASGVVSVPSKGGSPMLQSFLKDVRNNKTIMYAGIGIVVVGVVAFMIMKRPRHRQV